MQTVADRYSSVVHAFKVYVNPVTLRGLGTQNIQAFEKAGAEVLHVSLRRYALHIYGHFRVAGILGVEFLTISAYINGPWPSSFTGMVGTFMSYQITLLRAGRDKQICLCWNRSFPCLLAF